jgi:hypothetical protein
VAATGVVGVVTAPGAPSKPADAASVLSETRIASIAPSLDWASGREFLASTTAPTSVSVGFGHNWYERLAVPQASKNGARKDRIERLQARVTAAAPAKTVAAAEPAKAKVAVAAATLKVPLPAPLPERFAGAAASADAAAPVMLAYADPAPTAASGVLDALAAGEDVPDTLAANGPQAQDDGLGLPDDVPLPLARPKADKAKADESDDDKPGKAEAAKKEPEQAGKTADDDSSDQRDKDAKDGGAKVAYAKPDNPDDEPKESGGGFFSKLFGGSGSSRAKAGNGVAVYDISAKTVYMPDGTQLEAHSGIGEMADDPRYVNVKMRGPTPPHTYALSMRESRFHGVEALRMTPVNGKNLYGRGGFLTHSYLLRGGRAQSHGCVAFKNYPRFLAAFKAGKVKKLVVVAGGGKQRAMQIAKNGSNSRS